MKISLTFFLQEEAAVILVKEKTAEADQMMAAIVTVSVSTTEEETVGTTLEAEVETPEVGTVVVILVGAEVQANPSSIEARGLQKDQVEAEDAVATISVNRVTIILADELIFTASETGFDILQALNAAYVWTEHQQ